MKRNRDRRPNIKAGKGLKSAFGKTPTTQSSNSQKVRYSFEYMVSKTGYSIRCCEDDNCAALAKHLFTWGQMTWQQILAAPRKGLGVEKIAQTAIRAPLPSCVTPDTNLLSVRFNGKMPMVGFRENAIFHILFLDHTFNLYNHGS